MYQVIGVRNTLTVFGLLSLAIFLLFNHGNLAQLVDNLPMLGRAASSAVTMSGFLIVILGETPIFPVVCKLPLIRNYFPPIDGEWLVTVQSNWGTIQRMRGEPGTEDKVVRQGKVKITSRFFGVRMRFEGSDRYSRSSSVCVSVRRDPQHGTVELNYIYDNITRNPLSSDCNSHNGAARVEVQDENGKISMEGVYFTDRNWNQGLNTAGVITFERTQV